MTIRPAMEGDLAEIPRIYNHAVEHSVYVDPALHRQVSSSGDGSI